MYNPQAAENPYETPVSTDPPAASNTTDNMSIPMKIMQDMKDREATTAIMQQMEATMPAAEQQKALINPVTEQQEIPLSTQVDALIEAPQDDMTAIVQENMRIIPKNTVLFRLVLKPQYTLNSIKNSKGEQGQWFYITTKYAESEALNQWRDFLLQKYVTDADIKVPKEDFLDKMDVNYSEIKPLPNSAKVFILESNFKHIQVVEMYLLPLELLRDIYVIEQRRFVNLPKGVVVYSADDSVIETPTPLDGQLGCYFYTTRVLVEDYVLQQWRDMVLNVYFLNQPLTLPYGKEGVRDPSFEQRYNTYVQLEGTDQQMLLTSYFDDSVVGTYLKNEDATGEVFLMEQDLPALTYYGSFPIKIDTLKFVHGIQSQIIS